MKRSQDSGKNRALALYQAGLEVGEIGWVTLGSHRILLVNGLDLIREVLIARAAAFEKSDFQKHVMGTGQGMGEGLGLGNGMLTSSNAAHRGQQKLIGRLFGKAQTRRQVAAMVACADEAQARWGDGQEIDLTWELSRFSIQVIGRTLFSTDFGGEADAVTEAMMQITGSLGGRKRVRATDEWDEGEQVKSASLYLSDLVNRMIDERLAERAAAGAQREEADLLDLLLDAQAEAPPDRPQGAYRVDRQQIYDEIATFLLAGAENPKNALSWVWWLLALHPEPLARMEAEHQAVLGAAPPRYRDLERLPYTLQVFKEALRLFPPGYAFGRKAVRSLSLGGVEVPAGTELVISPLILHHLPEHFPDPGAFEPERFEAEREQSLPRLAYLPFGAGPRACIGARMALLEGQSFLATVSPRVSFELLNEVHAIVPRALMTLQPSQRLRVRVTRRS